jgi:hypothetical protein
VDTVDVDNPLLPVDLDNLSISALVLPAYDQDLVVFANRERTDLDKLLSAYISILRSPAHIVFAAKLLGKGSGHDLPAQSGGCIEVSFAALAAGRGNVWGIVLASLAHKFVDFHPKFIQPGFVSISPYVLQDSIGSFH